MGCSSSSQIAADRAFLDQLPRVENPVLLHGAWHVHRTTLPMWLHADDKFAPTLNYGPLVPPVATKMTDTVIYHKRDGSVSDIRGENVQDVSCSAHFTWRGYGLLRFITSEWYFLHVDHDAGVDVIYFTSTLFTPEGMDVVSRAGPLGGADNASSLNAAVEHVRGRFAILQPLLGRLATPPLRP